MTYRAPVKEVHHPWDLDLRPQGGEADPGVG